MCVCAHVCACACVSACLRDVFALYDYDISPRLIMIVNKIIILYFIQIRHTDDFHSTDTRLVLIMHVFIIYMFKVVAYSVIDLERALAPLTR